MGIPLELGRLQDVLETLDLSNNQLTGTIPLELTNLKRTALVRLSGNQNIGSPAPLGLCFFMGLDINNDPEMCPFERTALTELYQSLKGVEWTDSSGWLDPYESHCLWSFVKCNGERTIELRLNNNGLSGTLSRSISVLESLEDLDLSDNDIKGAIVAEIGQLSKLRSLRLSHNDFVRMEMTFEGLNRLEQVQLNGNRLQGTLPKLDIKVSNASSFVSDCGNPNVICHSFVFFLSIQSVSYLTCAFSGNPSDFADSLVCEECTLCCNSQGNCHNTEVKYSQDLSPVRQFLVFFVCLIGISCILASLAFAYKRYTNRQLPRPTNRRPSVVDRDTKYALNMIGHDSVYQFFLTKSRSGWTIAVFTIAAQILLLLLFSMGATIDWTTDSTALVYTWKCPRNQPDCTDSNALNLQGWLAFAYLMAIHLTKDITRGTKLIAFSAKGRHTFHQKARFFIGGLLMNTVALYTLYVSFYYNLAIATSNREIIENSVIILFVLEVDEYTYDILETINKSWVVRLMKDGEQEVPIIDTSSIEQDNEEGRPTADSLHEITTENDALVIKVKSLEKRVEDLEELVLRSSRGTPESDMAAQDSNASNGRSFSTDITREGNTNPQRSYQRYGSSLRPLEVTDERIRMDVTPTRGEITSPLFRERESDARWAARILE